MHVYVPFSGCGGSVALNPSLNVWYGMVGTYYGNLFYYAVSITKEEDGNWWLNGSGSGPGSAYGSVGIFSKNMGPDPLDCMAIDEELAYVSGNTDVCDFSGATFHVKSAHGHAETEPRVDLCVSCPDCGPARSSYTLSFHGYSNLNPVSCEKCAGYNSSFTVAHQFSGFGAAFTYGATTSICHNITDIHRVRRYYSVGIVTLKWTDPSDGMTILTRSGVTINKIITPGIYAYWAYDMYVDTASGSGDALPSSDVSSITVFCSNDPPDAPCSYALTIDQICRTEEGYPTETETITLSISWDATRGKVQFEIANGMDAFIGYRDDCTPNSWRIYPSAWSEFYEILLAGTNEDGNYIVIDVEGIVDCGWGGGRLGVWIKDSTSDDGLYIANYSTYYEIDGVNKVRINGPFPSTIADGVAAVRCGSDVCGILGTYVEVTAD